MIAASLMRSGGCLKNPKPSPSPTSGVEEPWQSDVGDGMMKCHHFDCHCSSIAVVSHLQIRLFTLDMMEKKKFDDTSCVSSAPIIAKSPNIAIKTDIEKTLHLNNLLNMSKW